MVGMVNVIDQISKRVLLTVAYSAQFGFPLSREEIQRRLFRADQGVVSQVVGRCWIPASFGASKSSMTSTCVKNEWFPRELVDLAIDQLVSAGRLDFDGKWYRLPFRHHVPIKSGSGSRWKNRPFTRQPVQIKSGSGSSKPGYTQLQIADRQLNNPKSRNNLELPNYLDRQQLLKESLKKRREAQPLIDYLSQLGWVEGVAITGSLALNSADEKDDADFLIITKHDRLWLTRLLVLYFAIKHGKRRSFAHEEPNSWCFNLWLDTNNLFVPTTKHSLYTAYEACQADWVINRHHTAQKFLIANSWVRQTLPRYYVYRQKANDKLETNRVGELTRLTNRSILTPIFELLELVAYASQRLYMKRHQTTERVAFGCAWFHPEKKSQIININSKQ